MLIIHQAWIGACKLAITMKDVSLVYHNLQNMSPLATFDRTQISQKSYEQLTSRVFQHQKFLSSHGGTYSDKLDIISLDV